MLSVFSRGIASSAGSAGVSVGGVLSLGDVQHVVSVVRRGDRRSQRRVRSHARRSLRPRLGVRRMSCQRPQSAGSHVLRTTVVPRPAAEPIARRRRPLPRLHRQVLPPSRRRLPEG